MELSRREAENVFLGNIPGFPYVMGESWGLDEPMRDTLPFQLREPLPIPAKLQGFFKDSGAPSSRTGTGHPYFVKM